MKCLFLLQHVGRELGLSSIRVLASAEFVHIHHGHTAGSHLGFLQADESGVSRHIVDSRSGNCAIMPRLGSEHGRNNTVVAVKKGPMEKQNFCESMNRCTRIILPPRHLQSSFVLNGVEQNGIHRSQCQSTPHARVATHGKRKEGPFLHFKE